MSKTIPFPNNHEVYLKRALEHYEHNRLDQALNDLKKAIYADNQDTSLYSLYLHLLLEQEEFDEALDFFQDRLPDIEEQSEDLEWDYLYIRLLLGLWELEKAQKILENKKAIYEERGYDQGYLQQVTYQLEQQVEALAKENKALKEDLLNQLESIDSLSFYQQQALLPQMNILDRTAYFDYAETLLKKPSFHPLLRAYLLEMLAVRNYKKVVFFNWFNQLESVDLSDLVAFSETPLHKELVKLVQDQEDLIEQDLIQQNVALHLSLLYPFGERVIKHLPDWIADLKAMNKGQDTCHYTDWLNKLEKIIQDMQI